MRLDAFSKAAGSLPPDRTKITKVAEDYLRQHNPVQELEMVELSGLAPVEYCPLIDSKMEKFWALRCTYKLAGKISESVLLLRDMGVHKVINGASKPSKASLIDGIFPIGSLPGEGRFEPDSATADLSQWFAQFGSFTAGLPQHDETTSDTFRPWKDASGSHQVEARLVAEINDRVIFQRRDGTEIVLKKTALSESDQAWLGANRPKEKQMSESPIAKPTSANDEPPQPPPPKSDGVPLYIQTTQRSIDAITRAYERYTVESAKLSDKDLTTVQKSKEQQRLRLSRDQATNGKPIIAHFTLSDIEQRSANYCFLHLNEGELQLLPKELTIPQGLKPDDAVKLQRGDIIRLTCRTGQGAIQTELRISTTIDGIEHQIELPMKVEECRRLSTREKEEYLASRKHKE